MKEYQTKQIRNIAIVGHQGTGKTFLSETMLFLTHSIDKKGEVEKKSTVSDHLPEEQAKFSSLSTSLIPIEFNDCKLNFLDTPGNDELVGDLYEALSVVKGVVIVIDATKGVEVGTERVWKEVKRRHIPSIIFINKMDKENVKYDEVLAQITDKLGSQAVPMMLPIGKEENFEGFINIIEKKGYIFDGKGTNKEIGRAHV